jgi:hypothetical protein
MRVEELKFFSEKERTESHVVVEGSKVPCIISPYCFRLESFEDPLTERRRAFIITPWDNRYDIGELKVAHRLSTIVEAPYLKSNGVEIYVNLRREAVAGGRAAYLNFLYKNFFVI